MKRHLCLLGDADSVHLRRWVQEMLAAAARVRGDGAAAAATRRAARAAAGGAADRLALARGRGAPARADLAPDIVHGHYVTSYGLSAAGCGRHPVVMTAWGSDLLVTPREPARCGAG